MTQPQDPDQPPQYGAPPPPPAPPYGAVPPPPYGAPQAPPYGAAPPPPYGAVQPPQYGAPPPGYGGPAYGQGYGMPPGQRVNDPAPMGMRLLARIIDGLLLGVVLAILLVAVGIHVLHKTTTVSGGTTYNFSAFGSDFLKVTLLFLVITVAYEVGMITTRGATLGKMAVGVRVAMLENGQNPTLGAALIRWVIPAAAGLIPTGLVVLIVYLSPFFDSTHRNRGWYDYAAKTIAVRTR